MPKQRTGGSTQNENDNPPQGRRTGALAAPLAAALLGALAGCQAFSPRADAPEGFHPAVDEPTLRSPLADAALGGAAAVEPVALDGAVALPRPEIELEPLPDPRAEDILERLRASFSLPSSTDPAVRRELEWFARHPDYFERVFERASPYLYHIAEQLEARGMPADLALLPVVESAFDPFAYSHGRAAGLWQIIPGTAKRLGVKQGWWFDGRRDVVEATRAALDYLETLHELFEGDWLLAIAGYNSGEGNVARALTRAAGAGRDLDFFGIRGDLPRETRTYVPRLLAIRDLVAEAEKHELTLPEIPNAPYFAIVETGGQLDMAVAAELAGIEIEQLYQLNAGVNRWATDPDGPHRLLVPVARAEAFTAALAELDAGRRVRWSRHRISPGETLITIASRYGTTPAVLKEINRLRNDIIRAGEHLLVPHALEPREHYALSADARLERRQSVPRGGERIVHVVRQGDSLWSISRRYGVGLRALASWNGMAPGDTLSVGRELVVWVGTDAVAVPAAASASIGPLSPERVRRVNYVVRKGDSLSSIAQRFRVSIARLLEWNGNLSTQRYLQPGDRLVMFVNLADQST